MADGRPGVGRLVHQRQGAGCHGNRNNPLLGAGDAPDQLADAVERIGTLFRPVWGGLAGKERVRPTSSHYIPGLAERATRSVRSLHRPR